MTAISLYCERIEKKRNKMVELEGTIKEEGGKERQVSGREEERRQGGRQGGGRENITESESELEFF